MQWWQEIYMLLHPIWNYFCRSKLVCANTFCMLSLQYFCVPTNFILLRFEWCWFFSNWVHRKNLIIIVYIYKLLFLLQLFFLYNFPILLFKVESQHYHLRLRMPSSKQPVSHFSSLIRTRSFTFVSYLIIFSLSFDFLFQTNSLFNLAMIQWPVVSRRNF